MIWLAVAVLLCCSAAVSASETALFSLGRQALERFRVSQRAMERNVHLLMQNPRRCLLTILLANTATNVSIFTLAFIALKDLRLGHAWWSAAASAGVLLSVIVFGEMIPKGMALSNPERLAPYCAVLVGVLEVALAPARWFLGRIVVDPIVRLLAPSRRSDEEVTDEELRALLEQSARDGVIDPRENEMLVGAVALSSTKVREVMTPRVDLQSISATIDPGMVRGIAVACQRRTLLVCGRDLDDLLGVVSIRDVLLNPGVSVVKLMRSLRYVPEQVNLVQLLGYFRSKKIQSAVVVDEYGGTAGAVSLVDITKRIVGERMEGDAARPLTFETLDEHTYRLPGDLSVRVWADRFGVREIDEHIDTIAGLILSKLGILPRPGDSVRIRNLTLKVETMERRRIATVILVRDRPDASRGGQSS